MIRNRRLDITVPKSLYSGFSTRVFFIRISMEIADISSGEYFELYIDIVNWYVYTYLHSQRRRFDAILGE